MKDAIKRKLLLPLDIQMFADDDDNPNPNPEVKQEPEVKTVTMTQEELDALIGREKGRVKSKYSDYDELKTKLADYVKQAEEKQRAEMTELERLQKDLEAKGEVEQTLAKQLEEMQAQIKHEKIRNEFIKVATSNQIAYLDDAFSLADLSAVTIGDDGKVVGMDEAIKTLVDNKPYLVAKKQIKQIGEPSNGTHERVDKTAEQLLQEAAEKARKSGRNEDRAAYAKLKRELGL
ncbi:hypothetical protein [Cytobacillus solani]|uniref:Clp protease ClpB n=1 Tax=Cytobacillus solani TaxID=1637975 RepID=A0A0Q3VGI9_9BACI|nr:hypothetical protein [Cytobacillus solani]KQL18850.1 hypothetical protein AN957_09895 [Cytobacillus solani]